MGNRYLLLGASSELCGAFLRCHHWQEDDEIIAQYFRRKDALAEMQAKIPARMELRQADFNDGDSTKNFANALENDAFVPTHILHVPAVPIENLRFTECPWEKAAAQINVQCRSLWIVLQAVIKKMAKAKRGKIILGLSSCSIDVPPKFLSTYVTAKYALLGLGKALAAEYAGRGLQVNMVSPSMMDTKFLENVYGGVVEQSAKNNPQQRNATPEDVASLIEYLFSEANTFITGANIPVTGGEVF